MKKLLMFLLLLVPGMASANWDNATQVDAGEYVTTDVVSVSSFTATAICTQDVWDVNMDVFNNSAFTLWIGSNTTTLPSTGFPILSSQTYTMNGQFTGQLYAIVESGAAGNRHVRCIHYKRKAR